MLSALRLVGVAALAGLCASPAHAQTWTSCNPTTQAGCPADPALGGSVSVDFTSGASSQFTAQGNPSYGANGAEFTVSGPGDAPTIVSKWYMMFGKYSITMKAAPGTGIVSSVVLQSDDLDEIDWEWLGSKGDEVQSNYFGKGQTTTYDRAAVLSAPNTEGEWHTYELEWTADQIIWTIDGTTARVLNAADANGQYPQTPMQMKIGSWAGGDPSNAPGTIAWAGGETDYSAGPFTMYVQSVSVVDYSTGTSYEYGNESGSWQSIKSNGGTINGNAGGSETVVSAPAITSTSSGSEPWDGTHRTSFATVTYTSLNGLPSGWTVSSSGKVVPPSAAPITFQFSPSTPSPSSSPAPFCSGGYKVVTSFDQRGFLTTATMPVEATTTFNEQGFAVTTFPSGCLGPDAIASVQSQILITSAPSTVTAVPLATSSPMLSIVNHAVSDIVPNLAAAESSASWTSIVALPTLSTQVPGIFISTSSWSTTVVTPTVSGASLVPAAGSSGIISAPIATGAAADSLRNGPRLLPVMGAILFAFVLSLVFA